MSSSRVLVMITTSLVLIGAACQQTKEIGRSTKTLFTGSSDAVLDRSPGEVERAIDQTIADLKLLKIGATTKAVEVKGEGDDDDKKSKVTETIVRTRNSADAKIEFTYFPQPEPGKTRVAVKTGTMGDSKIRQEAWDRLRVNLGLLSPATGPATTQP